MDEMITHPPMQSCQFFLRTEESADKDANHNEKHDYRGSYATSTD